MFLTDAGVVPGDLKRTEIPMKTCILADECDKNSINFGSSRMVISSKCCSSDLCNTEPAPGKMNLNIYCI